MRSRTSLLAAAVAAVTFVALTAAGPAAARKGPPEFFGLVPQDALTNQDFDRMGRAEVGQVRFVLNWTAVEQSDDQFDFAATDQLVGNLAAQGIRPFANVFGVPAFVSAGAPPAPLPVDSAKDRQEWQEFLSEAVGRYGPGGTYWTTVFPTQHPGEQPMPVETWQLWNEQNGEKHVQDPNPAKYAELLKISNPAIVAEDPNAEIVLGGMVDSASNRGERIKASKFLKRMYQTAGVANSFDAVSIHPYSPDIKGLEKQFVKVRKVLKKNDRSAGVWVTEIGWGSSKKGKLGVGKKEQAKLLKQSFKLLLKKRGKWNVGGVLWYTWRDGGDAPCDWCRTAGLFKANGTKAKPAWKKFVRFTGGN
jgi:alpha-L-arabinofuranosidase